MNRTILSLIILLALISCTKNDEPKNANVGLTWFYHSDCKGNKSSFVREDEGEKLIIQSEFEGFYTIDHYDAMFNCCLPEGLCAIVNFSNDTLYLNEKETEPGNCRCLCNFDLSSEIGNLEEGNYVLCLMKDSNIRGTISISFKHNMHEEVLISELKE